MFVRHSDNHFGRLIVLIRYSDFRLKADGQTAGRTSGVWQRWLLAVLLLGSVISGQAQNPGGDPPSSTGAEVEFLLRAKQEESARLRKSPLADRHFDELGLKARERGQLPVIIRLRAVFEPEGLLRRSVQVEAQRTLIERARRALLADLTGHDPASVKEFKYLPYLGLSLSPEGIESLRRSSQILDIEEDVILGPALSNSVPLIGASKAWESGYTGVGQTVAVVDTGIDKNHPILKGKVVSEGCFSTNYRLFGASSVCPGSVSSTTAVNSGLNCDIPGNECKHGTLVAGVIAGDGPDISGVAKDATLISLNVYSRFENREYCSDSQPCALSFLSDQVRALERVYDIRRDFRIAAVNFSISGRKYTAACDSDASILSDSIRQLAAVGIPTIAPTGNGSYTDATGMPACMTASISVGATGINGAGQETVLAISNSAPFIHLLAPGNAVTSSVPGGGLETWTGTSIATPHVAGSWALLKQRVPSAGIQAALQAFVDTGVKITDARNGVIKPRIQVDQALIRLSEKAPQISSYTISPTTPMDRDPFGMTINGKEFEFGSTRLYFCPVGTATCQEHPGSSVRVLAPSIISAENVALASGTWSLYVETAAGVSGRSRPFNVMVPPPPPAIGGYVWSPATPREGQPFNGVITGSGFSLSDSRLYFCIVDSSTCRLQPSVNVTVESESRISVRTITLEAGQWQLYVQTGYGASPRSTAFRVELSLQPPTITGYGWSPASPIENQPFSGVLNGTNFVPGESKVFFCATTATTCTELASSRISFNTASSLSLSGVSLGAGNWQIYVQTPGGTSARSAAFGVQPALLPPAVASFIWTPSRPIANQPFSGVIIGSNFSARETQVSFCENGTTRCQTLPATNITIDSAVNLRVSNVTLQSGLWQCLVTTAGGTSPRSEPFEVLAATAQPVISNVVLSTGSPTAFQPFSAVVSGSNFVRSNTSVFFCPDRSDTCQQHPASAVSVVSDKSLSMSGISLASGSWQIYLQTAGGTSNRSSAFLVEPPLTQPAISALSLNPAIPQTNEPFTATITGTGFVPGSTQLFVCTGGTANCTVVTAGSYTVNNPTSISVSGLRLQSGTWQFYVQTGGGQSGRSTSFTVQSPIGSPSITNQNGGLTGVVANQASSVTISGTGFAVGGTQVFICVAGTETCFEHPPDRITVNSPTSLTLNGIFLLAGSWEVYVQTPAGRSGRTSPFTVRLASVAAPTITGYTWSPAGNPVPSPFSGTINGTNFISAGTQVFFCVTGTVTCFPHQLENTRVINATTLTVTSVFLMPGSWQVYAQTSGGASERSASFTVGTEQVVTPTLNSFAPSATNLIEGTPFGATITGNNFVNGSTQVFFCENDGVFCSEILSSNVRVSSSTSIALSAVVLAAGTWQVYVKTPSGSSNRSAAFVVLPRLAKPLIAGFSWIPSPVSNQQFGGRIDGSNFITSGTKVFFCQTGTTSCTQLGSEKVIVTGGSSISLRDVVLNGGSWQFYVVTDGGTSDRSGAFNVSAPPQFMPTISNISWSSATLVSNLPFSGVVTGTNFVTAGTQAFFCQDLNENCVRHPIENVRVTSPTSLTISNVLLVGGAWQVYLKTTIGSSNRSKSFTVNQADSPLPSISGFVWTPGSPGSNQSFSGTINGSNFSNGAQVFFCLSGSASCAALTPSQIRVVDSRTISVSNVSLASGFWQFYIRTAVGNSSRSNGFTVFTPTGGPIQPTLTGLTVIPLVPLASNAISATLRGSNFVKNLTKVFACTYPSNSCFQIPAENVEIKDEPEIKISNFRLTKGTWQFYIETPNGISNRTRTLNVM